MGANSDESVKENLNQEWVKIFKKMADLREDLEKYPEKSREISLTKTKLEEMILWWHCERGMISSLINHLDELAD